MNHKILFQKNVCIWYPWQHTKWFESYLINRLQFSMYDNIQSEVRSIKCGVPQGSIIGPLLFIIYMNDICNASELLYTIMYADDTSVILSGNDPESLI